MLGCDIILRRTAVLLVAAFCFGASAPNPAAAQRIGWPVRGRGCAHEAGSRLRVLPRSHRRSRPPVDPEGALRCRVGGSRCVVITASSSCHGPHRPAHAGSRNAIDPAIRGRVDLRCCRPAQILLHIVFMSSNGSAAHPSRRTSRASSVDVRAAGEGCWLLPPMETPAHRTDIPAGLSPRPLTFS